eukprot:TRINITY_DN2697_c2_g1_i1.p1 TRINITY_DN2697_c2_g1~~TRINITY_DN2697_c2_g1_i1.p1  ORF type:complete len:317 (-),score=114.01 TRINITY_DN2697_c2_g1_i1:112-1062(-)
MLCLIILILTPAETTNNKNSSEGIEMLKNVGYEYNEEGKLVQIENGEGFKFIDQAHYDNLGDGVVQYIYDQLESSFGLERVNLPLDAKEGEPTIPIFRTPEEQAKDCETLLIICQGSGAVRPGMWARALCINNSLEDGTIFSYLRRAQERKWAVVVLNPNENVYKPPKQDKKEQEEVEIRENESPMKHMVYCWDNFCQDESKNLLLVAHSFGGVCTMALLKNRSEDVCNRLKAIALTDAVHSGSQFNKLDENAQAFFTDNAINWVTSDQPLNEKVLDASDRHARGCEERSAGHEEHPWTSPSAVVPIFDYLDEKNQ